MMISIVTLLLSTYIVANNGYQRKGCFIRSHSSKGIRHLDMAPELLSIAAGSVAGAVGVGFAYPLDSMKTKIQNIAASRISKFPSEAVPDLQVVTQILHQDGILSLYNGVAGVMMGNALVKACAFTVNGWALSELTSNSPTIEQLCISAAFAGMVTSFLSNPIERVKVLMQSNAKTGSIEKLNEVKIISHIINSDGVKDLAFRGLDATLAREIPGYSLYFVAYFVLMHGPLGEGLGPVGPVVIGALSGMLSWLIVFPLDVCKTNLQNIVTTAPLLVGNNNDFLEHNNAVLHTHKQLNLFSTALMLKEQHGMGIFVKGITPKMMQAGVNHSVTFYVYDLILKMFST